MKNVKIILGLSVLGLAAAGFLAPAKALAYQGDYTKSGPNYTPERHERMLKAIETNDYNAWSKLMSGKGRVTQIINESNFARFAEAHKLAKEGKYDKLMR